MSDPNYTKSITLFSFCKRNLLGALRRNHWCEDFSKKFPIESSDQDNHLKYVHIWDRGWVKIWASVWYLLDLVKETEVEFMGTIKWWLIFPFFNKKVTTTTTEKNNSGENNSILKATIFFNFFSFFIDFIQLKDCWPSFFLISFLVNISGNTLHV